MQSGRTEFELKFAGAPADVAALSASDLFAALAPAGGAWERLVSHYYDTADGALAAQGLSIRMREEGGGLIQAVKAKGVGPSRREFETELASRAAFPAPVGEAAIDAPIAALTLSPIASTTVDRWAATVSFKGAEIEIAVDLGRMQSIDGAGRAYAAPLAELELELISGDRAAVFALARLICAHAPLRLSPAAKLEKALSLQRPATMIARSRRARIAPEMSAGDALSAALTASAERIAQLQPHIVDLRSPEGVHQMRVALRRFRATERIFRRFLADDRLVALAARAKIFAGALGPARDWDVFVSATLSDAAAKSDDGARMRLLRASAEAMRAAHWASAVDVVGGRDFARFTIDLCEAGALGDASPSLRAPVSEFAVKALNRALKRVRRAAAAASDGDAVARHRLRIALKKLRYAALLFRGLYPKEHRKAYMAALSALQDALGGANDAVAAQRLADEAAAGAGEGAIRAAGFVAGYKAAESRLQAGDIDAAIAAFDKMTPFWNKP